MSRLPRASEKTYVRALMRTLIPSVFDATVFILILCTLFWTSFVLCCRLRALEPDPVEMGERPSACGRGGPSSPFQVKIHRI